MKATISADGSMTIQPENGLEEYSLQKWFEDWGNRKVALCLDLQHPHDAGSRTYRQIKPQTPPGEEG